MKFDSAVFDLDGTLWDSTDTVLKAWNEALKPISHLRGPLTREELHGAFGKLLPDIGRMFMPMADEATRESILASLSVIEHDFLSREGGRLYGGLEETLKALSKEIDLFIVSNCQTGYIEGFLQFHKLGSYFRDIECAGATGKTKSENIRLIVERNQLELPVYIGDTALDYESAEQAGLPFIHAAYGFGSVPDCYAKIDSFPQLVDILLK